MSRVRVLPYLVLLALHGCDEFDPALYQQVELAARQGADACREASAPELVSSPEFVRVDLAALDDSWQVANCAEGLAPGNDGFFAVDMEQGQKFHFHVNALDAIDPVLYVVDSCDERVCQPLNAAASCPGGKEHLSFVAPRAGRYYVGVDGADPGGGEVELLAISPRCGDGEKEHSEACDDGNRRAGDGCDSSCRLEIAPAQHVEREPNDDLSGGNVLAVGALPATLTVRGMIEGPCDPEVFTFGVPSPAEVSVRVLGPAGAGCAVHPELRVELQLLSGSISVARGLPEDDACPSLPPYALLPEDDAARPVSAETTYHVRLAALGPEGVPPIDYTLEIDLVPR
jgi:cysteine-rich repeat protein